MRKALALVAAVVAVSLAAAPPHRLAARPAVKQCLAQSEDAIWKNVDPNTRGVPRIQLRFVCQDQIINGQLYPPGPPWYIHVWGKCHPTNCDWGEVGAQRLSTGWVFGQYNQGYARRYVYAKMSVVHPGQLYVYIWTDFTSPTRSDYAFTGYFVHE